MSGPLDEAMKKLESSIGLLEASVSRRLAAERTRADLETELQIMQDDRARLAVELDGASNRLGQVEAAAEDVGRRVNRAIGAIQEVIAHASASGTSDR
jgi:predicted  nucleic acid-binding Zn-ribbon protein